MSWEGSLNTFHQPVALMSSGERSEEMSSPMVGTSQNRPTTIRKARTSPPLSFSMTHSSRFLVPVVPVVPAVPVVPVVPVVAVTAAPPA